MEGRSRTRERKNGEMLKKWVAVFPQPGLVSTLQEGMGMSVAGLSRFGHPVFHFSLLHEE